ncbi:hypothetical protein K443DRAFT_14317 [Laccaria amethystina LaAM-08-1]|uniref:Uncharacterized protein n=1 Tax=Laccaria amethystina LaAM-08-1 TaxID=1095629 RepID=A0A0C9WN12_9AGAR|nr:hypothetical protein K443DRAFT_14317 [Laccaria amethystina LaAM-08-1]
MPCTCARVPSKRIRIQCHYPPLTLRAKFSPERLLTPPPSPLKTKFPLVEVPREGSCENETQLAESGISNDELSDIQVFIRSLIKDHLKAKVCFSKQSTSALDAVFEEAKEKYACLQKKHELVVGIVRQELRRQNTATK